jgi:hypothetical protein
MAHESVQPPLQQLVSRLAHTRLIGEYARIEYAALPVKNPSFCIRCINSPFPDVRGVPTAGRRKLLLSSCFEKTNWPAGAPMNGGSAYRCTLVAAVGTPA